MQFYKNGKVQYLTPENGGILKTENVDGNLLDSARSAQLHS